MGSFTGLDDYVNRMTGGNSGAPENVFFSKLLSATAAVISNPFAPGWVTTWRWDGIPGAGAVAAAAAVCDKTTVGSLQFTNSAGSAQKMLVQAVAGIADSQSVGPVPVLLVDRLLACGGLSGTVTTAQTVGGTIGRYTGGVGNQIWIEIQTTIGTSTTTVTASYTNEAGTAGRTTQARMIGGSGSGYETIHNALPLALQAGDKGVRSVQSITLVASTGTAGNIAVVIYHPITLLVGSYPQGPFGSLGAIPEIVDDACLTFLEPPASTHRSDFMGMLCMVDV